MSADEMTIQPREPSPEELAAQEATELPDREAMTLISPGSNLGTLPVPTEPTYTTMPIDHGYFPLERGAAPL